jgi:pimeloyl-ACP methyl ester carboxylesterase
VAIIAAAEIPEIKAVVADSAFASVDRVAQEYLGRAHGIPDPVWHLILVVGRVQVGVDPAEIAPVKVIDRIAPRPILIIHGEEDELFHVSNAKMLADAAGDPKELWIGPEHGHTSMIGADLDGYAARVLAFFGAALAR